MQPSPCQACTAIVQPPPLRLTPSPLLLPYANIPLEPLTKTQGKPGLIKYPAQMVLKKALAYDGLARGLHEVARAIEKDQAKLCVLAEVSDVLKFLRNIPAMSCPRGKRVRWQFIESLPQLC